MRKPWWMISALLLVVYQDLMGQAKIFSDAACRLDGLSGCGRLTTPVSVANGGTGASTLTGILQGNGTSAITGITNSSTVGQTFRVTGAATYAWGALDLADSDAVTGVLPGGNLPIGSAVQAWDADLDTFAGLAKTDNGTIVANGTTWELKLIPDCADTGGNHLNYTSSTNAFSCGTSGASSLPVVDTTSIVEGSSDATKELRFEVDGFTTGTVRVLTPHNRDGTIADLGANVFTGAQTLPDIGAAILNASSANKTTIGWSGDKLVFTPYSVNHAAVWTGLVVGMADTFSFSSTTDAAGTTDTDLARVAAGVTRTVAATGSGWHVDDGASRVAADVTNITTTMAAVTGLSATVKAGRFYTGKMVLYVADSVAADGVKIDFDGGAATMTAFRAHCTLFDTALLTSAQTTAIATDVTAAVVTGDAIVECHLAFTVNGAGTFVPRQAQVAHTTGTLTVYRESHLQLKDTL